MSGNVAMSGTPEPLAAGTCFGVFLRLLLQRNGSPSGRGSENLWKHGNMGTNATNSAHTAWASRRGRKAPYAFKHCTAGLGHRAVLAGISGTRFRRSRGVPVGLQAVGFVMTGCLTGPIYRSI